MGVVRGDACFFDGGPGDEGPARRHAPARRRESVALASDDDQIGIKDGDLDAALPVGGDEGPRKERVQHARHVFGATASFAHE